MKKSQKQLQIGIIGAAGDDDYNGQNGASKEALNAAQEVGRLLGEKNVILVTGGKSGIMEFGAKGAKMSGGQTIGVVKGPERFTSNKFTDIEVISGMNSDGFDEILLVNMCDSLIVVGGGAGTLQEIAVAYRNGKPIVALELQRGWGSELAGKFLDEREKVKITKASNAAKAVELAIALAKKDYE